MRGNGQRSGPAKQCNTKRLTRRRPLEADGVNTPRSVGVRPDSSRAFEPPLNERCLGAPDDDEVSLAGRACRLDLGDADDLGVERVE